MYWDGDTWNQAEPESVEATEEKTEQRSLSSQCCLCLEPHKKEQKVAKWRCGHSVCVGCFAEAKSYKWRRCAACRKTKTAREVVFDDVGLSCFFRRQ